MNKLEKLKEPIPYKWREQSTNQYGCTVVAYIDARDLFDRLDEVLGVENWQSDVKLVDGKLFGGIGIRTENGEWIWKWDTGSESNVEKEKGEVSDALKRAGVQFGVGRFLYSLGTPKLKVKDHNGKYKPTDDSGNIIWNKEDLTKYCNSFIESGVLDRTKVNSQPASTPQPKIENKALPWLNKDDSNYANVEKALKEGKATIAQVETKYKLSKKVKEELGKLITA